MFTIVQGFNQFYRLNILEGDTVRQQEEFAEERQKLKIDIQSKDEMLMEQKEKVEELQNKLSKFEQASNQQPTSTASNLPFLIDT